MLALIVSGGAIALIVSGGAIALLKDEDEKIALIIFCSEQLPLTTDQERAWEEGDPQSLHARQHRWVSHPHVCCLVTEHLSLF